MSNIQTFLEKILSARYGKDVRQSIHDAIVEIDGVADTAQGSATRSAQTAANCMTSAKTYMESAKASEESAKASAEKAAAFTPEGYFDLVDNVNAHTTNKLNPHGVTKEQVGLGSVPNVSTNDQTPTYTVASENENLTSGEKLSVAFRKIAKAIASLITHLADSVSHITSIERTKWDGYENAIATNAVNISANTKAIGEINSDLNDKNGKYYKSGNLNDFIIGGTYTINTYEANNWANLPNTDGGINTLIVSCDVNNQDDVISQTFIHKSGIVYNRYLIPNSDWTEWVNTYDKLNSDLNDPLSTFNYVNIDSFCGVNAEVSSFKAELIEKNEYYIILSSDDSSPTIYPIHFLRCKQFPNSPMGSFVGMGWNGNGYYSWKGSVQIYPTNGQVVLRTESVGEGVGDTWTMGIRGVYYK